MRILYYNPYDFGGVADHVQFQSSALNKLGCEITILTTNKFNNERNSSEYECVTTLIGSDSGSQSKWWFIRKFKTFLRIVRNHYKLYSYIKPNSFDRVLISNFSEYMAPIWFYPLYRLRKKGVKFGVFLHDPVRKFVVGPYWWHRLSIWCAYTFASEVFLYADIEPDTVWEVPGFRKTIITDGIYHFPDPIKSIEQTKETLNIPDGAKVMLAFGHIRDEKKLDLFISQMGSMPDLFLIVAGKEQKNQDKVISDYQKIAKDVKVAERCRWLTHYVSNEEASELFNASDFVLLTYSSSYVSASGVLFLAVRYRKPCLASSGESPLKKAVNEYELGVFIEPDSPPAIAEGMHQLIGDNRSFHPQWEKFMSKHSWEKNAEEIYMAFGE